MDKQELRQLLENNPDLCKDCANWGTDFCLHCLEEAIEDLPEDKKSEIKSLLATMRKAAGKDAS